MKRLTTLFWVFMLAKTLLAQDATSNGFKGFDKVIPQKANKELQVFAYFYQQNVTQNYFPSNDFLKGQIVGRLFGNNTTVTSDSLHSLYAEQRLLPFLIYSPKIFDGKVTLRTSFEIDWTWGDVAYGVGGNFGSAISADQVNIQTQNVAVELIPAKNWSINIGLQRLFDTPHDPYRTVFDKMTSTAYRLAYWGTDGVGISIRHENDYSKIKGGFYKLYENNVELNDDVTLFELNGQVSLKKYWNLGASCYWVHDRSSGKGGVSILGQGFASNLTNYNGTFRFPINSDLYKADVLWLGSYFSRNEDFIMDRWLLSGFANVNVGSLSQLNPDKTYRKSADILGIGANFRMGYRYGQTTGDAIIADVIFTSGDKNSLDDKKYSGVLTGNTWGSPGGLFIGHGGYLLFPHGNVVNRFVAAISDISNTGLGVAGGTLNFSHDFIPNKLHAKIGTAAAMAPIASSGGGNFMGIEANGKVGYDFGAFLTLEAHAAYLSLGDFYDGFAVNGGSEVRPVNPWVGFICLKWLIF